MAFERALGREFNFNEADLSANRAGGLSADQLQMVQAGSAGLARSAGRGWIRAVVICAIAVVVTVVAATQLPGGSGSGGSLALPIIAVAVAVAIIVTIATIGRSRGKSRATLLRSAGLHTTRGPVSYRWDAFSELTTATVGDARFGVAGRVRAMPDDGTEFIVYYVPHGDDAWVMSVERAGDGASET